MIMYRDDESQGKMIDELIKLFFVHTPSALILDGTIQDRKFPADQFEELMSCYVKQYSDTEAKWIYSSKEVGKKNIFETVIELAHQLLIVKNNQICCRYEKLLRWREITRYVGEDLLVCGFITGQLVNYGKKWVSFDWPQVLGHDNKQLNSILQEGISDNHFHLFGSAPIFPLSWIRLMNNVRHGKYMAGLMGIQSKRRSFQYHLGEDYEDYSPNVLILLAALMRAVMYSCLERQGIESVLPYETMDYLSMLKNGSEIVHDEQDIYDLISQLKLNAIVSIGKEPPDYLFGSEVFAQETAGQEQYSAEMLFRGERKLVYDMLCDIMVYNRLPEEVQMLLYPYLVIRTWFRGEMVQSNDNIGFDNFQVYSGRKKYFLPVTATESEKRIYWLAQERKQNIKWMVQNAVFESFRPGNLDSLEIRITPCNDFRDDVEQISYYDDIILENKNLSIENFFYVYHFIKRPEKEHQMADAELPRPRDDKLRKLLYRQAREIRRMRQIRPEIACRLKGIDACSKEIHCRPEVFACAFRCLKSDVSSAIDRESEAYTSQQYGGVHASSPQLFVTYHVGEDFLDAVDGLRALDEAMEFLDMSRGDRFGHATVLGLDLQKWYEKKGFRIYLSAHDYLDNVVWFYNKIIELQIEGCETLKDYLMSEYYEYYQQIYGTGNGKSGHQRADIFIYYEAWKLRGDAPELYESGTYSQPDYIESEPGLVSLYFPENQLLRYDETAADLYYRYQFDGDVKRKGKQPKEINIPMMYVEAVIRLQRAMQKKISERGIGIETNPSSNLFISTMENYAEHPILNLYTLGLNDSRDCAQMFVSINTDDRGVFNTSLENEYALLASSVENIRDNNGNKIYNPQNVYDWINRIRIMGNAQVFDSGREKSDIALK